VTEQSSAFDVIIPPGHERVYQSWHFAPAGRTGDTIYVSGVIGPGPDGSVPEDPGEEFSNAFAQLADTLAAAGPAWPTSSRSPASTWTWPTPSGPSAQPRTP
jgi:enamine deaminase RidA (YjgF/YER057c/UK114 family)